jgi:predicted Zn-dependent peptidase
MAETSLLGNQCRLITEHIPTAKTAAVGIWLQNGARYESSEQTGYAHFLEHLVFKGTSNHSGQELSTRFEVMGGHVNAETGRELTSFHGIVPTQYACDLLSLLIDMLTRTVFSEREFSLERDVVLQELAMLKDDPEEALEDFSTEQVWAGHSMGRQILGTRTSLENADMSGFRKYIQNTITANRLCIVAVGNFDQHALQVLCEGIDLAAKEPQQIPAPVYTQSEAQLDIKAEQKHLVWVMPASSCREPQYAAYEIANHILAGGYDSRLYQVLREQLGLVYSIDSRNDHYSDTGLWFIQTNTEHDNTGKTIAAVQQTLADLITRGPTQQELDFARAHLQSALIIESEDLGERMNKMAQDILYHGHIISLEEQLRSYEQVTTVDIQSIIKESWEQASFFTTV